MGCTGCHEQPGMQMRVWDDLNIPVPMGCVGQTRRPIASRGGRATRVWSSTPPLLYVGKMRD
jgi:hypothetical protein